MRRVHGLILSRLLKGIELNFMPLELFIRLCNVYTIRIINKAIIGLLVWHLIVDLRLQIDEVCIVGVEARLKVSKPHVPYGEVLLHSHHLMQELFLQIEVLLLDFSHCAWIFDIILVNFTRVLPLHSVVVALIVTDTFRLECFDDAFNVLLRTRLNLLPWQDLVRDVTIVKVDTLMSILHFDITTDCRHSHDLLIFALRAFFHGIAVVHWDRCDVLEGWLESAAYHHVLLNEFDVAIFLISCNFLRPADRKRVH